MQDFRSIMEKSVCFLDIA